MTLVLIGKGLVLRGWPSKIEAKTGSIIPFWESSRCPRRSPWILFEKRCRAINYRRGKAIGDQLGNVYRKQEIKGKVVGFVDFWADEAQIEIHHPLLPNIIPYCQETKHVFFFKIHVQICFLFCKSESLHFSLEFGQGNLELVKLHLMVWIPGPVPSSYWHLVRNLGQLYGKRLRIRTLDNLLC